VNGNGTVDYSEFLAANLQLNELLTNEKLQAAFNLFDIDQNGKITIEEIKSLLGGGATESFIGSDPNNDVWRSLMYEGDENDDGEITFEEFKVMMQKLLAKNSDPLKSPNT
jgi:Ca2+-binding EF-hand superfamily protein